MSRRFLFSLFFIFVIEIVPASPSTSQRLPYPKLPYLGIFPLLFSIPLTLPAGIYLNHLVFKGDKMPKSRTGKSSRTLFNLTRIRSLSSTIFDLLQVSLSLSLSLSPPSSSHPSRCRGTHTPSPPSPPSTICGLMTSSRDS